MIVIDIKISAENIEKKCYVCEDCEKSFNSDQSMKKHILIEHHQIFIGKEKASKISYRFNCPVTNCRRSLKLDKEFFTSRKHLQQHYYKVHNSEKFNCTKCCKKFSTEMLRNLHVKNCGKVFTCHCNCCFNSKEALQTHQRRKHPEIIVPRKEKISKKSSDPATTTRTVSTTTSGLGWNSNENLTFPVIATTTSVFTSTDQPISSTKSTATDEFYVTKSNKNSSTSTQDFNKEENSNSLSSSSSQNKKNVSWSGDFDDSLNIFDSDVKMEFYSAETQTDLNENLLNNNYTQTTFNDLYDFEKYDIQTQTNWDE